MKCFSIERCLEKMKKKHNLHVLTLLGMGKMHHVLHRYFFKVMIPSKLPFRIPSLIFLLIEPDTLPR